MRNVDFEKVNAIVSLKPELIGKVGVKNGEIILLDLSLTVPSKAEIEAEVARLTAEQPRKEAEANRASAYRSEADPLFFKAQRGEATTDEWTAKVAEIKARFPYPGGEE